MNEFIEYCKERVKVAKQQNENDVRLVRPIAEIEELVKYLENFKMTMEKFADV